MDPIPSAERCLELLHESGCSEKVINHCCAVRDVAVRIAKKANANVPLVEAGALLHDIGRSTTHGVMHAVEGVKIARRYGLPLDIMYIIERHLGAGIPQDEAIQLGLPPKDYLPETLEEKIVAHADNLIHGTVQQPIEVEIREAQDKGLPQVAKRLRDLHKYLSDRCGIDINDI